MAGKLHKHPQRKLEFPALTHLNHSVTSAQSLLYNCFAYAMGDVNRQWRPDPMGLYYWPPAARRETTIGAMEEMLGSFGYRPTESRRIENGVEKVAVFVKNNAVTHFAKQLSDGKWTSKLGDAEDIKHVLDALNGPQYGAVARIYSRPL